MPERISPAVVDTPILPSEPSRATRNEGSASSDLTRDRRRASWFSTHADAAPTPVKATPRPETEQTQL